MSHGDLLRRAFQSGWDAGFLANDEWAKDGDRPAFEDSLQKFRASLESTVETAAAREALWEAIIAFANHDQRWKLRPEVERKIDELLSATVIHIV